MNNSDRIAAPEADDFIGGLDQETKKQLWMIATYAYGTYVKTLPVLQQGAVQQPHEDHARWAKSDMADCAKRWCETLVGQAAQDLWDAFKPDLYSLVCTDDEKHKDLRNRMTKAGKNIASAIATAITGTGILGAFSPVLTPLVAVGLGAGVTLGRKVLCTRLNQRGFANFGVMLGQNSFEKSPPGEEAVTR